MKGVKGLYPDPYIRGTSGVFHFAYVDPKTGKRRQKSTGATTERDARKQIKRFIDALADQAEPEALVPFLEYSRPFFVDGACPRQARKRDEGQPFGLRHMEDMRNGLERIVGRKATGQKKARDPLPFASIIMSKVTRADLLALRSHLRKDPGGRVGQTAFKAVKLVFAEAYERGDLSNNPAVDVSNYKRPKTGPGAERERDAFTIEELRSLYHHRYAITALGRSSEGFKGETDTRPATALVLAMGLGIRQAELRALRWENVDLERGTVSIVESTLSQATQSEVGPPKWGKLRPDLPLPAFVRDELQHHHDSMAALIPQYVAPSTYVICNVSGLMVSPTWFNKLWQRIKSNLMVGEDDAVSPAGVPASESISWGDRLLTWHSLRHSANTHALIAGAPPLAVAEYLGWTSPAGKALAAMQSHYAHLQLLDMKPVAEALDRVIAQPPPDNAKRHGQAANA